MIKFFDCFMHLFISSAVHVLSSFNTGTKLPGSWFDVNYQWENYFFPHSRQPPSRTVFFHMTEAIHNLDAIDPL